MAKYEYIKTWTYNPSQYLNKFRVCILPENKIDKQELAQFFPTARIEMEKDHANTLMVFPAQDDENLYYNIVEYLCSLGWEPFAVENGTHHFRRLV